MLGQNMSRQGSKGARVPVKLASSQRKDGDGHFSFSVLPGLTEGFGSQRGSSSPTPCHAPPPPHAHHHPQKAFNPSDSTVRNVAQGNN